MEEGKVPPAPTECSMPFRVKPIANSEVTGVIEIDPEFFNEIGTICVLVPAADGAVIATDTLTTSTTDGTVKQDVMPGKKEPLRDRVNEKIFIVEHCVMTTAGTRDFNLDLVDKMRETLKISAANKKLLKGDSVAEKIRSKMREIRKNWTGDKSKLISEVIFCLYETHTEVRKVGSETIKVHKRVPYIGKVTLKDVDADKVDSPPTSKFACIGSCQGSSTNFLKKVLKQTDRNDINLSMAIQIAATAVYEAYLKALKIGDPSPIGGYIRVCIILPGYGEFVKGFPLTRRRIQMDRNVTFQDLGPLCKFEPMTVPTTRPETRPETREEEE